MNVTICIPTRNRPDDLAACLDSIAASSVPVTEIVVSDDSTDCRTRDLAVRYPHVKFVEGPRKGLGSNRNTAISAATGDWILFLDDDARLGREFLETLAPLVAAETGQQIILTGIECQITGPVHPNDQDFLGFQTKPYTAGQLVNTLVINATLFPAELLRTVRFDPRLIYGYDEVDIALRARQAGYSIRLCTEAVNLHFPSPVNRGYYRPHTEAARIYVTFKKYLRAERRPAKAALFLAWSFAHSIAHHLKADGLAGVPTAARLHWSAWRNIADWLREPNAAAEPAPFAHAPPRPVT